MKRSRINRMERSTAEALKQKALVLVAVIGSVGLTACGAKASPGPGYDVSYPQCSHDDPSDTIDLPNARSFAIVGLNNGRPKTVNPCFNGQMDWARGSVGNKDIPKAGVYVNAANPGQPQSKEWPRSGSYQGQACHGEDSVACASLYGQSLAAWDIEEFQKRYGNDKHVQAKDLPWWIDVESGNSWECNAKVSPLCGEANAVPVPSGAYGRNAAVLNGMAAELQANGITVGMYTNARQWNLIVANLVAVDPETYPALHSLAAWVSGAASRQEADDTCKQQPFGGLGRIALVQYTTPEKGALDKNVVC